MGRRRISVFPPCIQHCGLRYHCRSIFDSHIPKKIFQRRTKRKRYATQRDHRRLKIKRLESKSGLYFYLYYQTKPYYEKSFNLNNNTTFLLCWVPAVRTKHRNKKIKKTYLLPCG